AAGLVGDDDLEVAAAALAGPGTHGLPHGGADLGEDRHLLADPERAEVGLLAALGVADRVVGQQVADGLEAESLVERGGGPLADDVAQAGVQAYGQRSPLPIPRPVLGAVIPLRSAGAAGPVRRRAAGPPPAATPSPHDR